MPEAGAGARVRVPAPGGRGAGRPALGVEPGSLLSSAALARTDSAQRGAPERARLRIACRRRHTPARLSWRRSRGARRLRGSAWKKLGRRRELPSRRRAVESSVARRALAPIGGQVELLAPWRLGRQMAWTRRSPARPPCLASWPARRRTAALRRRRRRVAPSPTPRRSPQPPRTAADASAQHQRRQPCLPSQRRPRPRRRATRGTVFSSAVASVSSTSSISVPRRAVIVPQRPASAASIACRPNLVARTRSKAVGVPPR